MALQLKNNNDGVNTDYYNNGMAGKDGGAPNPWDNPNANGSMETYQTTKSIKSTYVPEKRQFHIVEAMIRLIVFLVVAGVLIFVGKTVVSKVMPDGIDVTGMLSKPEMELEKELGVTFTDNTTWQKNMVQYSGGDMTIRANEDLGVVYINKKHVGIHIHTNKYKLFGIQVGMSEKKVYDTLSTTFQFDNFMTLVDSDKSGKTTYYYYRARKNDCIAIVIKNNTNRVDTITYYNNYKQIIKEADTF